MHPASNLRRLLPLGFLPQICLGAMVTVSTPDQLQSAIDACDSGCQIQLSASTFVLSRPILIEGKKDLRLTGSGTGKTVLRWHDSLLAKTPNPFSALAPQVAKLFTLSWQEIRGSTDPLRPTGWLMWPSIGAACSLPAAGPAGACNDTLNPYSRDGHQQNGMILISRSRDVQLEGLELDGVEAAYFYQRGIWDAKFDLVFGNVGVNLYQSLRTRIVGCELHHFWTAIHLNDENPNCHVQRAASTWPKPAPRTACGDRGAHVVDGNRIHHNWWALQSEVLEDMGSTFRENLTWNNQPDTTFPWGGKNTQGLEDLKGGFLRLTTGTVPGHVVSGNTIVQSSYPVAWLQMAGLSTVFSDNLVGAIHWKDLESFQQMLPKAQAIRTHRNAFIVDTASHAIKTLLAQKAPSNGDSVPLASPIRIHRSYQPLFRWNPVQGAWLSAEDKNWYDPSAVDGAARLLMQQTSSRPTMDTTLNRLCIDCGFQSTDSTSELFLSPRWGERNIDSAVTARGFLGRSVGVLQKGGNAGVDGYLWAWDVPRMDAAQNLHLPFRVVSKNAAGSLEFQSAVVTSRGCPNTSVSCTDAQITVPLGSLTFSVADGTVILPLAGKLRSSDSLLQIDLWAGAREGGTLRPLTPAIWTWAKGFPTASTTRGPRSPAAMGSFLSADRHGRTWILQAVFDDVGPGTSLTDLRGRNAQLRVVAAPSGTRLEISQAHPGAWFLRTSSGQVTPLFLAP